MKHTIKRKRGAIISVLTNAAHSVVRFWATSSLAFQHTVKGAERREKHISSKSMTYVKAYIRCGTTHTHTYIYIYMYAFHVREKER